MTEGFRTPVAEILRRAGHIVVTASNGVEGVALYRSSPDLFHVVLTDLRMPTMDGYQLVELLRETNSTMKIICMSGGLAKRIPANTEFVAEAIRGECALCMRWIGYCTKACMERQVSQLSVRPRCFALWCAGIWISSIEAKAQDTVHGQVKLKTDREISGSRPTSLPDSMERD